MFQEQGYKELPQSRTKFHISDSHVVNHSYAWVIVRRFPVSAHLKAVMETVAYSQIWMGGA